MANRLIEHNRARHDKSLRAVRSGGPAPRVWQANDETHEATEVVRQIRALLQRSEVQASDIAILFRTNEQPRPFETELRKAKLPYVLVGGVSFFDRKEVKDLLAYFRLLDNPHDEMAARRLINTPPRGIGKSAVERLVEASFQQSIPFSEVLRHPLPDLPAAARQGLVQFVQLIDEGHSTLATQSDLVAWARQQIDRLQYRREVDRLYSDPDERESRWFAVEAVVNALAQFVSEEKGRPRLSDFLDQMAIGDRELDSEKERQLARNAIMLMTMHSAKGLEFPYVFIVGLEEGILPHHRSISDGEAAIEEERRLCYVGVTRAQEQLTLSMALTRLKWGKPRDSVPSRFLYELTGQTSNPKYEVARSGQAPPSEGPSKSKRKPTTPHGRVKRTSSVRDKSSSSRRRRD
jgi:DNA helicase-2/ATP-dependent DNA helicase PcrA